MDLGQGFRAAMRHSMRAYYVAIAGGILLIVSAFLPWLLVGETPLGGVPGIPALWVLGLGILAIVLASLSIITRKNSRHPLLLVGLVALGILFLSYRFMARAAAERAWAVSQAVAIVDQVQAPAQPASTAGVGIYLGMIGAIALVLLGMTIVIGRASQPYAQADDDDV